MPDALTEARAMDLPAAAVARLARHAQIGLDDAEVVVARLVLDLREAGWIVERREFPLPPLRAPMSPPGTHDLHGFSLNVEGPEPVDPRVARALLELARGQLFLADEPLPRHAIRQPASTRRLLDLAQGKIE